MARLTLGRFVRCVLLVAALWLALALIATFVVFARPIEGVTENAPLQSAAVPQAAVVRSFPPVALSPGPNDVFPYSCTFQCSANDVVVEAIWFGDEWGNAVCNCTPGQPVTGNLWAQVDNGTGTSRYAVKLVYTYTMGATQYMTFTCLADVVPPGVSTYPLQSLVWTCGESLTFQQVVVSWHTSPARTCENTQQGSNACPPGGAILGQHGDHCGSATYR